jgi:hypothetical protein
LVIIETKMGCVGSKKEKPESKITEKNKEESKVGSKVEAQPSTIAPRKLTP